MGCASRLKTEVRPTTNEEQTRGPYHRVVKGIKEHEELQVHVDGPGTGTIWLRIVRYTPGGEPDRGLEIPLTLEGAANAAFAIVKARGVAKPK